MMPGKEIAGVVRGFGVTVLADINGHRLFFFPRGKLPNNVGAWLEHQNGARAKLLREYLLRDILRDCLNPRDH